MPEFTEAQMSYEIILDKRNNGTFRKLIVDVEKAVKERDIGCIATREFMSMMMDTDYDLDMLLSLRNAVLLDTLLQYGYMNHH